MFKKMRDPISALTHISFAVLSIPTTALLVYLAVVIPASVKYVVAFCVFGCALFLLYSASGIYHWLNISERITYLLRKVDHMMIFVLIAGTYTPICLLVLNPAWGTTLLVLIWATAIGGIIMKAFWINAPRQLTSGIYVAMGWMCLIAFVPLKNSMTLAQFVLLAAGGLIYTIGAVVYALKWPRNSNPVFGFHEIFHLFVMGGTSCHVALMFSLVVSG